MADYCSREKLAAYITIQKMWDVIGNRRPENDTIGGLVNEVVKEIEEVCEAGKLSLRIMEFERDPDAT